jgi:3'(2'), 5'-bisphosphate nucleotidase
VTNSELFESWKGLSDADFATVLAEHTGQLLVQHRQQLAERGNVSVWQLKDSADLLAHHFLMDAFSAVRPDDAVLSEEGHDNRARVNSRRVWIVDPLDGTNEYGEGRADWAVHIALWEDRALTAGAVSLPSINTVFSTDPAPVVPPKEGIKPRLVTSRNRAPYAAILVAENMDCDAFRLGSAGAKAMSIIMGEADIYVHDGGMHQWDSAAPAAVALAAGLHASRLDGSPLEYNDADTWLPDFFVCRPEYVDEILLSIWGRDPRS